MKLSFTFYSALLALLQCHPTYAYSKFDVAMKRAEEGAVELQARETRDGQTGRIIKFPPPPADTGIKKIPDVTHPFRAPGSGDMRGPCPALNTLANHGYISRDGVVTPEEALMGIREGFNIEHDFGIFLASVATLGRGNAFIGKFSIGLSSPKVPPLPNQIDGPTAGGIAKHGRFEGDVSISRADAALGDNKNFQPEQFIDFETFLARFGDDGVDGPNTIVTNEVFTQFKKHQYDTDRAADPKFSFQPARVLSTFNEVAQVLELFANGTTKTLSISAMQSIFQNQRFASNWFRRASPAGFPELAARAGLVRGDGSDFPAGEKVNGRFVANPANITGENLFCVAYKDTVESAVPAAIVNTTGILKQNVNTLLDGIFHLFNADGAGCTQRATPKAISGS